METASHVFTLLPERKKKSNGLYYPSYMKYLFIYLPSTRESFLQVDSRANYITWKYMAIPIDLKIICIYLLHGKTETPKKYGNK